MAATVADRAHLPVAMWNDEPFDRLALFSGSATVIGDRVVIVFPGLCSTNTSEWPSCSCTNMSKNVCGAAPLNYAFNMIGATPANVSDPAYTHWRQFSLANNTKPDKRHSLTSGRLTS